MAHAWRDKPSQGLHLALVKGSGSRARTVPVRVHEPLSVLDALEVNRSMHSWSLDASLKHIAAAGRGVAVLLNCGESAGPAARAVRRHGRAAQAPERGRMDLRTYGVGAQILRECGVQKHEPDGRAAAHAQHGRLRPGSGGLHAAPERTEELKCLVQTRARPKNRLDGKEAGIGIVQARFNQGVTNTLAKACWDELLARGVQEKNIDHVQVPGALEVPVALQAMAERAATTR
jgi:hypothetical protein